MLHNYLKTALRILVRQPAYSFINIFGLTVGIASCLVIMLYIKDELSYDRFHKDAERIYRVDFLARLNGQDVATALTGLPMAEALMNEAPPVESVVRINKWNTMPVRYEDKSFTEKHFLLADSNFFQFFSFNLISGNPQSALTGPNKVIISELAAIKYFGYKGAGDTSPLGKIFAMGSRGEIVAEVTGIAQDVPSNSHIQFDFVLSLQSWEGLKREQIWLNSSIVTYFKTKPNADVKQMDERYTYFIEKYCEAELQQFMQMSLKQLNEHDGRLGFQTTALTDIHLRSNLSDELEPNGNIQYLYLFGCIAVFIIVLACINFMNLSTARSANRAKEVGVRKTIGALRSRLIGQFLMESYLYTFISVLLALVIISASLNLFNQLTFKTIEFTELMTPFFVSGLILFVVLIGLLAGSYPAFYLTSYVRVIVSAGVIAVLVGLITIGFQSLKAAMGNPVDSLRSE